jgi:hypothetical protein
VPDADRCAHEDCTALATHIVAWIGPYMGDSRRVFQCAAHLPWTRAKAAELRLAITVSEVRDDAQA